MPDYEKMYIELFRAVTAAIEALQGAQQTAEETFICGESALNDGGEGLKA